MTIDDRAQQIADASGAARIASGQLTAGAEAQLLVDVAMGRRSVSVLNTSDAHSVAIGPEGVTPTTGHILPPGSSISVDSTAALYVVAVTGAPVVSYLESRD